MSIVRVTGQVLESRVQSGTDYSNTILKVLVGKSDVTEVRLGDRYDGPVPRDGDHVDLLVMATAYMNDRSKACALSLRGLRPYPVEAVVPVEVEASSYAL